MAQFINNKRSPGVKQPFNYFNPDNVVNLRPPSTDDIADISTLYVQPKDVNGNPANRVWVLTNVDGAATWTEMARIGASVEFSELTVTPGPISLTGTTTINTSGIFNTSIGSGTNSGAVVIGNITNSGTSIVGEGVVITGVLGANEGEITLNSNQVSTTLDTIANTARLCSTTFSGFTTAAAATQVFTVQNPNLTITSVILGTAIVNQGANNARMTIHRTQLAAGSLAFTVVNDGAAALNGNVVITFWYID